MMGVSTPVQAVNIAQDGLGQVLVFPYYTTKAGWSTLFNLTNTSNKTVIIKVRWREGFNSRDVRDFNVVLSPYDTWTASTGAAIDGARVITADKSCTYPTLTNNTEPDKTKPVEAAPQGTTGINFADFAFTKHGNQDNRDTRDPKFQKMDRTEEGYFEVFNMGSLDNVALLKRKAEAQNGGAKLTKDELSALQVVENAKHVKTGGNKARPKSCKDTLPVLRDTEMMLRILDAPANVLKGRAILVKGKDGIAAGYDPLVLANFAGQPIYQTPDSKDPNLNDADPIAVIINDDDISKPLVLTQATNPGIIGKNVDAVTQLISRSTVINDYNVTGDSQTAWVLTFPTKNFYVDRALHASSTFATIKNGDPAPLAPFADDVNGEAFSSQADGKSCFDFNVSMWDREEFDTPDVDIVDQFSPREPGASLEQTRLCYEANILSFGDSDLFSSSLQKSLFKGNEAGLPGLSGWAKVTFGKGGARLPVIGMRVEIRNRGDATVNYGLANNHAYRR
jgi:hypothetical protein